VDRIVWVVTVLVPPREENDHCTTALVKCDLESLRIHRRDAQRVRFIDEAHVRMLAQLSVQFGDGAHLGLPPRLHELHADYAVASVPRQSEVHFISGPPDPLIASVDDLELESVVAKYAGAPYQGGRTSLWRKLVLRRPEEGWRIE
jgi:hypothetical protein